MSFINKARRKIKESIPKNMGEETLAQNVPLKEEMLVDSDNKISILSDDNVDNSAFIIDDSDDEIDLEVLNSFSENDNDFDTEESDEAISEIKKTKTNKPGFFSNLRREEKNKEQAVEQAEKRSRDILQFLNIPATFEIEDEYLLPDDFSNIVFDHQAPYGYDMGQVGVFVEKSKASIRKYINLLRTRNEHIAQLATVIDKLEVDLHNLRYQNEINNGISIMPTYDEAELESKLMEERLKTRRLEDKIKQYESQDSNFSANLGEIPLSLNERERYDMLQDDIALIIREKEALEEENYDLKNQIAMMEEEQDNLIDYNNKPSTSIPFFGDDENANPHSVTTPTAEEPKATSTLPPLSDFSTEEDLTNSENFNKNVQELPILNEATLGNENNSSLNQNELPSIVDELTLSDIEDTPEVPELPEFPISNEEESNFQAERSQNTPEENNNRAKINTSVLNLLDENEEDPLDNLLAEWNND